MLAQALTRAGPLKIYMQVIHPNRWVPYFLLELCDPMNDNNIRKVRNFGDFCQILRKKILKFVFLFMNSVPKRKSKGMSPPSILTNYPNNIFKSFLDIAKIIFREIIF